MRPTVSHPPTQDALDRFAACEADPFYRLACTFLGDVPLLAFEGPADATLPRPLRLTRLTNTICEVLHLDPETVTKHFLFIPWLLGQATLTDKDLYAAAVAMGLTLGHCYRSR